MGAILPRVAVMPLGCTRCGGNIYAETYTEESETGADTFVGFELKCLLCGRPWATRPFISLAELVLFWGVAPDIAARARWGALSCLWLSADRAVSHA